MPAGAVPGPVDLDAVLRGRRRPARPRAITSARSRPPAPEQNTFTPCERVALDVRGRLALAGRRIRAPHAQQVVLGVDPVERQPLVRVQMALEDPPDATRRPWRRRAPGATPRARVGGGVSAPASRSARTPRAGTRAARRAPRRWRRSRPARHGRRGRSRGCTTPGWKFGFPNGIGTGQPARADPVRVPAPALARPAAADQLGGRARVVPPRAGADPVVGEHDPAVARARARSSMSCALVAAPVVRVARHPTISSCRARARARA